MRDSYEITNAFLDSVLVELRHMDVAEPDTGFEMFGKRFRTPLMAAAFSHLDQIRPNGIREMARGFKGAGAAMSLGFVSADDVEAVIGEGADTVHYIKPYADRDKIFQELEDSREKGCFAVGMDIDHGLNRNGEYDMQGTMKPVSTAELKSFITAAGLPFIVKGVLSKSEAAKCVDIGAAGLVLSHHHSIIDYAIPPYMILPEIRKDFGTDILLITDGIYSGADAFKALAFGADSVMLGRVMLDKGFHEEGSAWVTEKIQALNMELKGFMGNTGASTLKEISREVLHFKNW